MDNMINFAIDLGTTNSLVAKFTKGTVEVFKNPKGQGEEILPSVVSFRSDRIVVGKMAKVYSEKEPKNVVSRFKRKMGTTEAFRIASLGRSVTPVELSAEVLKELKTFIRTGEAPQSAVITIPACFDMVQSNATKEAGHRAGFKQVVLLQEPIAASLAYANKEKNLDLRNSQWIVYDLGGGTFDVALVKIVEGELKVIDHEGNNYLGGSDFDAQIVESIIAPQLQRMGTFTDLVAEMKSETGRYNRLWCSLLNRAEQAKIELSSATSAEIDLNLSDLVDEAGKSINACIQFTRSEFEAIIKDSVDSTADMLRRILTRNSLRPQDLKFVLMVGGCSYIPFVRSRIEELLGIPVDTGIDPTNAIVVGAAYFAATKEIDLGAKAAQPRKAATALKIKVSYSRASQEREELFAARVDGDVTGMFYRITRHDGGYDSGLRNLTQRIQEDLPLQEETYNLFTFKVYDSHNNAVAIDFDSIQIAQGKYSVAGQMLPEDLSLVRDTETGDTTLDCIFSRNSVLPARTKRTVEASKAVAHGSNDAILIMVVEGPSENHFTANKYVGVLEISGKMLKRDIVRGTEIDLSFEVSESRDLTATLYVNPSGPTFSQVFTPQYRDVPVRMLGDEIELLRTRLEEETADALATEKYEVMERLEKLRTPIERLGGEAVLLPDDDVTDDRYKLQDTMRKIAQELNELTSGKALDRLRSDYEKEKDDVTATVSESGNDLERRELSEIVAREHVFLPSRNPKKLEEATNQLRRVGFKILRRKPDFLDAWFEHLLSKRETFNDQVQARSLIEAGKRHRAAEDFERFAEVIQSLYCLLPQKEQETKELRYFTGIS